MIQAKDMVAGTKRDREKVEENREGNGKKNREQD